MQNIGAIWLYPLMSLVIDHYGLLGIEFHQLNISRVIGGLLMVAGIALIARF